MLIIGACGTVPTESAVNLETAKQTSWQSSLTPAFMEESHMKVHTMYHVTDSPQMIVHMLRSVEDELHLQQILRYDVNLLGHQLLHVPRT